MQDIAGQPLVALVNESFAKKLGRAKTRSDSASAFCDPAKGPPEVGIVGHVVRCRSRRRRTTVALTSPKLSGATPTTRCRSSCAQNGDAALTSYSDPPGGLVDRQRLQPIVRIAMAGPARRRRPVLQRKFLRLLLWCCPHSFALAAAGIYGVCGHSGGAPPRNRRPRRTRRFARGYSRHDRAAGTRLCRDLRRKADRTAAALGLSCLMVRRCSTFLP